MPLLSGRGRTVRFARVRSAAGLHAKDEAVALQAEATALRAHGAHAREVQAETAQFESDAARLVELRENVSLETKVGYVINQRNLKVWRAPVSVLSTAWLC